MMSFILLDEHLRACSQDSSNKIKPLFTIKQTTGLSSVRIEFSRIWRFSNTFAIKEKFEQLTLPAAVDLSSSNSWLKINQ